MPLDLPPDAKGALKTTTSLPHGSSRRGKGPARPTAGVPISKTIGMRIDHVVEELVTDHGALRRALPDVAAEVLELCAGSSGDAAKLERTLTRDPFITAQVVSIANSAMFAPRMPILGVRDAIVRIGISAVRDVVVMVVASSKMFRLPGFESHLEVLRRRMLAAAPSARALARALRTQPEAGFLTGLLHDIGELLLLERCAQKGILTPAIWSDPVEGETARERIHAHHTAVGAALCRSWKLPASVVDAAQFHHDYRSGGKTHLPAHLAAASDALREYVLPNAARPETPAEEHPVLLELGLTPAQILNALDEARPASAALIATR